jgi:hypothetical protein
MNARWEGDDCGVGIDDGQPFMPGVAELLNEMERAHWVAEEPEVHLLPHVQRAVEAGGQFTIESAELWGAIYEIRLRWLRDGASLRALRGAVYALVAAVAETHTHVRQRIGDDRITFDVTIGTLDTDAPFKGHGHLLRLVVRGPEIERVLAGRMV